VFKPFIEATAEHSSMSPNLSGKMGDEWVMSVVLGD